MCSASVDADAVEDLDAEALGEPALKIGAGNGSPAETA